jgi:gliding motility-associated-like protein
MLRYACLLAGLLCVLFSSINAQNTCATADPFCSNGGVTYPAGTNLPAAPAGPNYGCLFTSPNPAWYALNIANSGPITITLSNSGNFDIDFIIWGPFADEGSMCTQIFAGAPIVDCSYSAVSTEIVDIPNAVSGQWYMLMITNFSNQVTNITANQTGGTGSTNCSILCSINSITATASACDPLDDSFDLTGNISVFAPPTSGFLTITESCGGNSIVLPAPFNTNIAYTFPNLTSSGSPCTVTATFSADPTCTATANFNSPQPCFVPDCTFLSHTANVTGCDPNTITYDVSGTISFDFPPATGTLTVEMCSGETQTFNAPFVSPIAYSFTGLEPNNSACSITASFSDESACTYSFDIQEPFPCSCPAAIGTFGASGGTNNFFCSGETLTISSNGNFVAPVNVSDPGIAYDPAIGYFIYTCQPTVFVGDITADPCFVGLWTTGNVASAVNDGNFFNQFPGANFQDGEFYVLPVTLYNQALGEISVTNWVGDCFDVGTPMMFTFLEPLTVTDVENCQEGKVIISPVGGGPASGSGTYTISNVQPNGLSLNAASINNGGSFQLSGLVDGMNYSYTVTDNFGCNATGAGGPFVGPIVPTLTPIPNVCSGDASIVLQATPAGGTWIGPGVSAGGSFSPSNAGPGDHTLTYTPAGCAVSESMDVTVVYQPNATITSINSLCIDDSPVTLSAVDNGGVWTGTGITSAINGVFNPVFAGIGTHSVTYTINGFCSDVSTINITVHGLPEASFESSVTEGCTPLNVNLSYTGSSNLLSCTWEINEALAGSSCGNFQTVLDQPGCYDVRYSVIDVNGCQSSEEIDNLICATASPTSLWQYDLNGANVLNPTVSFTNFSSNATVYEWNFANQSLSNELNPVFTFDIVQGSSVQVCLRALNDLGCIDTECQDILIPEVFFFYVPNTFTPNNDGYNDVFKPSLNGVMEGGVFEYEFQVLNKWGERVFYSTDPEDVWVGDVNGGEYYLPDGLYYWRAKIRPVVTDAPREYEGHLFILR